MTDDRKRILIVTQYFWPEEFRINDLVSSLSDRGHQVVVLTGWPNYPGGEIYKDFQDRPACFAEYAGAQIIRVPIIRRGRGRSMSLALNYLSFALSGSIVGLLRFRSWKFDSILVFQTSPITAALPALLVGGLTGTKVLIWVQDLWPDTLEAVGATKSTHVLKLVGRLVRFIYKRCHRILIQSAAFEPGIRRYSTPDARVDYFPNWAAPEAAPRAQIPRAPEMAAYEATFNILFTGNLGDAQDLDRVLDAADKCREIRDLRWIFVGDGRARAGLAAEVKRRGLEDRVALLGRFPSARMPEFFMSADALLVSLRPEPIFAMTVPSKIQSYMAAAKPILAMLDGEGARVIDDAGCGFSAPAGDSDGLSAIVRRLKVMSPEERRAMGQAGRDYAVEHFDRERLIDRLEQWMTAEA